MNRKSIIILVLAAAVVAAALVFDGMSRRHATNSSQAISQNPVTATPATGASDNSSNTQTDVQGSVQGNAEPNAPADAAAAATEPEQNAAPDDASVASEEQADANATAPDDTQAAAAQPIIIPAGTALTVRLGENLGSRISEANQRFSATLDRDVVVDGQTVIAAGANVTGRVVLARPAGTLAGEANLQIKVTSVNVNNSNLRVLTSVRSFGPQIKGKNKVGRFMKGLVKRAAGDEREVLLADQSAYSFTLRQGLQIAQ